MMYSSSIAKFIKFGYRHTKKPSSTLIETWSYMLLPYLIELIMFHSFYCIVSLSASTIPRYRK